MLLKESRTSFTEMAKSCKISVCAVRMRYNRLKKAGIINGEYMHVNPEFWGYEHTIDIRIKTSLSDEEEIIKMLNKKPRSASAFILGVTTFGDAVMGLALLSKLENLRSVIEEIGANPKVKHVEALIWAKSQDIFHPENLIIKPLTDLSEDKIETRTIPAETEEVCINETDKRIIRILANSSRKPFSEVAKELGMSTHNVINRYRRLREGNVITRSSISVDLNKLGYGTKSINFLKLGVKVKIPEIRQQLLQIPNVIYLIEHVGAYDLRIDIPLADIEDIFLISKQIHAIEGIESVNSTIHRCPELFPLPLYPKILSD
jgi:Lrp/AsnC family transcriptional regulator for asnA, asnC and gidA